MLPLVHMNLLLFESWVYLCLHFKINIPTGRTKIFGSPFVMRLGLTTTSLFNYLFSLLSLSQFGLKGLLLQIILAELLIDQDITSMFLGSFPRRPVLPSTDH